MKKQTTDTYIERLNPSYEQGLTTEEVTLRKSQGLTNHLKKGSSKSLLSIIIDNFCVVLFFVIFFVRSFIFL